MGYEDHYTGKKRATVYNQVLIQILTQALIQTKTEPHAMVTPVLIGLHVIWDQRQGGGSLFSNPPPPPPQGLGRINNHRNALPWPHSRGFGRTQTHCDTLPKSPWQGLGRTSIAKHCLGPHRRALVEHMPTAAHCLGPTAGRWWEKHPFHISQAPNPRNNWQNACCAPLMGNAW